MNILDLERKTYVSSFTLTFEDDTAGRSWQESSTKCEKDPQHKAQNKIRLLLNVA